MWVIEAKSYAVKSNIAQEPGMLGPWIKADDKLNILNLYLNIVYAP